MNMPTTNEEPMPKMLKRIQTFTDSERKDFVKRKVRIYPKNKRWLRFKWRDVVQFFGLMGAFKVTRALGGRYIYYATVAYRPQRRSSEDEKGSMRYMKVNREDLKNLVGEEPTRLIYKYLKQTYIDFPNDRVFEMTGGLGVASVSLKTMRMLQGIDRLLGQGLTNTIIARRLRITPQMIDYYINRYGLIRPKNQEIP